MLPFSFTLRTINPLPLVLTAGILFGVLAHDTLVDRAASAALAVPVVATATYGILNTGLGLNEQQHSHVEQVSIGETLHQFSSAQPRAARYHFDDNDRKRRVYAGHDEDSDYHWPSL